MLLPVKAQQLIESIDMVKVAMGEQNTAQRSLDEWHDFIHITAVHQPRTFRLRQDVATGAKNGIDDLVDDHQSMGVLQRKATVKHKVVTRHPT